MTSTDTPTRRLRNARLRARRLAHGAAAGGMGNRANNAGNDATATGGAVDGLYPTGALFTIVATGTGADAADLGQLAVTRPPYVMDLQSVTADETFAMSLAGGEGAPCTFQDGAGNTQCMTYESNEAYMYMSAEKVQEWSVSVNNHPLHIHINPYQVISVTGNGNPDLANWHQPGDWYDTFLGSGTVRFRTDTFLGKVVMHCHLLEHEDEGCMAVAMIIPNATNLTGNTCVADTRAR